jgi:transposase
LPRREVAAFTGLVPRRQESGTLRGRTRLSKVGSSRLRRALYMPAIVAIRHNPLIKAHYQRLLANGKSKMAALGAAMRKLIHIAFGVLKSGKPFDPSIALGA